MTEVALDRLTCVLPGAAAPVIDGLSLRIAPGELLSVLGPSGTGKTTLLRLIAGLAEPVSGDIAFDGRSVLRLAPEARGAAMVFQNLLLFPHMTIAENVGFGLRMRGMAAVRAAALVEEMLERAGLGGLGERRPAQVSGGQQQRAALARALIVGPRVLLLDEPLSSLDAHLRQEMRALVRSLQRDLGITTIFVTHDQEEAAAISDRIAIMMGGRLRQVGAPEALWQRPADAETARFLGGRNFVDGTSDGRSFAAPFGVLALPPGGPSGRATLTFRPESVRLGPAPENAFDASVTAREFLGATVRLTLDASGVRLEALLPPDAAAGLLPGGSVTLNVPPQSLWLVA
jgi:ABC-type Fe3+/spermidine/putrescine transport system ATPase subunit